MWCWSWGWLGVAERFFCAGAGGKSAAENSDVRGVSIVMGVLYPKMAGWFVRENPYLKWMVTGGTPIQEMSICSKPQFNGIYEKYD